MTDALSNAGSHDFWVPAFELRVGDRPAGRTVVHDVLQVVYKDSLSSMDSFDITINNWDAVRRQFKYIDDHLFDPGRKLDLAMGYLDVGRLERMITGQITSLRPSFLAGGQPTLMISGLNDLHRLRQRQHSEAYVDMTDSKIAERIAQRIDMPIRLAPRDEQPYPYLFQDNQYDVVFLFERARLVDYDLVVEEGEGREPERLYFGPTQNRDRPTYQLTWGKSLIDFRPSLTTANQVARVTVRGWDPVAKKPVEATAGRADLDVRGLDSAGEAAVKPAFDQRGEIIVRPVHDVTEARREARAALERIVKDMVTATGSTIGVPQLRAGAVVQVSGLGNRFSGRYLITASTHTIGDNGYTTSFECRREELS